ncbi:MAG: alpha/beta hydrolase-fold protein [Lachnospiraceae bacterium]|nr:alpha/beta hydrolase-fold protein [Lachnospiraceae bacterium]
MSNMRYELDHSFPKDNGYVLLPTNREGKAFPVLYLFHGSGQQGCDEWIYGGNIENNMNKWTEEYNFSPMIIVMPRNKRKSPEGFKYYVDQFSHYMEYIEKYYGRIVLRGQANTAVAGISMGGAAALYCSYVYKTRILHTAAFSPSEFVHSKDEAVSWIPSNEAMDIGKAQGAINFIGYGDQEPNFERIAKKYIDELNEQGILINRYGLSPKAHGGHSMSTFLTLLERFLKIDIFGLK